MYKIGDTIERDGVSRTVIAITRSGIVTTSDPDVAKGYAKAREPKADGASKKAAVAKRTAKSQ